MTITFQVLSGHASTSMKTPNTALLREVSWNDWWEFKTLYELYYVDQNGVASHLGEVKIGTFDQNPDGGRTPVPHRFTMLTDSFLSVGQDARYYQAILRHGVVVAEQLLTALRDMAWDDTIFKSHSDSYVARRSLLRSVPRKSVTGQYRRIATGGAVLTEYSFHFAPTAAPRQVVPPISLEFRVKPNSTPPTNIHAIIGMNGVGKTRFLNAIAWTLADPDADPRRGTFGPSASPAFLNTLAISFSAFDRFELPRSILDQTEQDGSADRPVSYIGLRGSQNPDTDDSPPKSPLELAAELYTSLARVLSRGRTKLWRETAELLNIDSTFEDTGALNLMANWPSDVSQEGAHRERVQKVFSRLSSGHGATLLIVTRVIEMIEERTLLLMDEPEAHLHPPLLAALLRALSNLLSRYNGVAIVTTHSPVVLQEVPRSCVWKMDRVGDQPAAERPSIETFGENVGTLTREVFGLQVSKTGFTRLLEQSARQHREFDRVLASFDNQIGAEGQSVLRAILANMSTKDTGQI